MIIFLLKWLNLQTQHHLPHTGVQRCSGQNPDRFQLPKHTSQIPPACLQHNETNVKKQRQIVKSREMIK